MAKKKEWTEDDDALLDELGVEISEDKPGGRTPREARIIAGFEEIQRFVDEHGHAPVPSDEGDIFERLYSVRLDRLRALPEAQVLLAPIDHQGLLAPGHDRASTEELDDEALLAELLGAEVPSLDSVTELRHVRSRAEIRAAEEIANREPCEDFADFQPLFEKVEREVKAGVRKTLPFGGDGSISQGNLFILSGQLAYVAEVGELVKAPNGENDARLRVIYANGTQSNLLLRSLQRALYKDEAGRRISEPDAGPLFNSDWQEGDVASGTIYVLRSLSDDPLVVQHRDLIHKIGVTGGDVKARIAHAKNDATYLLADVEVVAEYKLAGINRVKLENLLHRIFTPAQIEIEIKDRFGHPVRPKEWFLVPLPMIDEAVNRIRDGSIKDFLYDPKVVAFVARKP